GAQETLNPPYRFTPAHYGRYALRVERFTEMDALGLFTRRRRVAAEARVTVAPSPLPLALERGERESFLDDPAAYSLTRAGHDPSETFRIREYVPGDSIRQIHWKLSEKTGRTLVRELGLPVERGLTVYVHTADAADGEALDAALELAFSLAALDEVRLYPDPEALLEAPAAPEPIPTGGLTLLLAPSPRPVPQGVRLLVPGEDFDPALLRSGGLTLTLK
ncbi:MAG: DUF58 domain-containing protein, partial [bacterium]